MTRRAVVTDVSRSRSTYEVLTEAELKMFACNIILSNENFLITDVCTL